MRKSFRYYKKYVLGCLIFLLAVSFLCGVAPDLLNNSIAEAKIVSGKGPLDNRNPQVQEVMAVQNRHTKKLMSNPDVVGTGTGLTEDGTPAIIVFTKKKTPAGVIPGNIEGKPVVEKVTGEFFFLKPPPGKGDSSPVEKPTSKYDPPVPIGVSTGNEGECSAGTIGARVKDVDGNVYALSNNHVYALENTADPNSRILQPGLYDTHCKFDERRLNVIGNLYDFVHINFNNLETCDTVTGENCNIVDAAIATTSKDLLDNKTPSDGYGTPSSAIALDPNTPPLDILRHPVKKYGRTTSLTRGTIDAIDVTMDVNYGPDKIARFIHQIVVIDPRSFIMPGDSGSLLVTDDSKPNRPVGLLFAGNLYGTWAIANRIYDVLNAFHVTMTIDDSD
jgi:hypothetical protein